MNKEKQISLIKNFITSNEETLLINQVNDNIAIFYQGLVRYYVNKQGAKINIDSHADTTVIENDLFGTKSIQIFNTTNAKKIDALVNVRYKKIIFTDYKNFKRLNSKLNCINGYQFEKDVVFFIKSELNINNDELIYYCKNNIALLFSETSKYLINSNQYFSDHSLDNEKNHILDIRKAIFENKKNNFNIKSLYQNIKKEAEYKKLSFLTF